MNDAALPTGAREFLTQHLGESWTAVPLQGDASVRRYFRITLADGTTRMLAWYPLEVRGQLRRSLEAYDAVSKHAYVPRILEHDGGSSLQQDIGNQTLFDLLHTDRDEGVRWYRKAITLLVYFQRAGDVGINPPFTADFFRDELEMTREFYVEKLMGIPPSESLKLQPSLQKLSHNVSRHPFVLCHRDYHGQNIHTLNGKLWLIDYQDLRMGPDTYDLASLLRDRGVAPLLGDETEIELVDYYAEWRSVGVPGRSPLPHGERRSTRRRYFETLLQRSIKILGTFSKQPLVRGRMWYLDFIPPTIESIRRCLAELQDYAELYSLLPMNFSIDEARERAERIFDGETQNHTAAR
ncbi:MAG: phosphotransferase [Thermoanaerobaculia bacterium]